MTIKYEGVLILTNLQKNMMALDNDLVVFEGLKNSLSNNISALEETEEWETEADEEQKASLEKANAIVLI